MPNAAMIWDVALGRISRQGLLFGGLGFRDLGLGISVWGFGFRV